jgi:hypothetical protein
MKRKIYLLSVLFVFVMSIFCQQKDYTAYYSICNMALQHKVQGDCVQAIELYQKAFNDCLPFSEDIKNLIKCYLAQEDSINAYKTLQLLIKSGYKIENQLPLLAENGEKEERIYFNLSGDSRLDSLLLREYDDLRREFLQNNDQQANEYMQAIAIMEHFSSGARYFTSSTKKRNIVENANWALEWNYLFNLLRSDIDLSRERTDFWEDVNFVMALIHTEQYLTDNNHDSLQVYLSLLADHVKQGNLHPTQYAIILDNVYSRKSNFKFSYYGYDGTISLAGMIEPRKIKDIETVDKRREELFLPPLWVYYQDKNYPLPASYKPKTNDQ